MSAPNIVAVTTITGKSVTATPSTTGSTLLLSNAAASGKVIKVNTLYIGNIDGTSNINVSINYNSDAAGTGSSTAIASTIPIPANATLVVISKDAPVYLEEDRSITMVSGTASKLTAVCSYEEIS